MFGISGFELLIIAVFVMVIFGPDKLPELAKQFAKAMNMFKKAQDDMQKLIKAEMYASPRRDESEAIEAAEADSKPTAEDKAAAEESAAAVWSATEEDDEEEDEE